MPVKTAKKDASIVVARDASGRIAVLDADFPQHGGRYLFLPGGRREDGESPEQCAARELREEAGITAARWTVLHGSYLINMGGPARMTLHLAEELMLGEPQLTTREREQDFRLTWMTVPEILTATRASRFLMPVGPLAVLLAEQPAAD